MRRRLILDAVFGLGLKLFGTVLLFALSVYISRRMGAAYLGAFSLFMSILMPMSVLARFGFDINLLRLVSPSKVQTDRNFLHSLYWQSCTVVLLASTVLALLMLLLWLWPDWQGEPIEVVRILGWLALVLPFHALLMLNAAFIRGNHRVVWAAVHENITVNLFVFIVLLGSVELYSRTLSVSAIATGIVFASLASCLQIGLLLRSLPMDSTLASRPSIRQRFRESLPMLGTALATIAFATLDVFLLSFYLDYTELGYYAAAAKLVGFVSFPIMAVIGVIGPRLADADAKKDHASLRKTYRLSTQLAGVAGLPVVLIIALFPEWLLTIFGGGFGIAVTSVYILLAGQFANLLMGPVGYLLWMTGHAGALQKITLFALVSFVLSSLILMPILGMEGAAIALSMALILKGIGCGWLVKERLNFNPIRCSWMNLPNASS